MLKLTFGSGSEQQHLSLVRMDADKDNQVDPTEKVRRMLSEDTVFVTFSGSQWYNILANLDSAQLCRRFNDQNGLPVVAVFTQSGICH